MVNETYLSPLLGDRFLQLGLVKIFYRQFPFIIRVAGAENRDHHCARFGAEDRLNVSLGTSNQVRAAKLPVVTPQMLSK